MPTTNCLFLTGKTMLPHDGVVMQQGSGAFHLRDNLFFFEPVPPGTILVDIVDDDVNCCTDSGGAVVSCGSPAAANSYRVMLWRVF